MFACSDQCLRNKPFPCNSSCIDVCVRLGGTCVQFKANFDLNMAKIVSEPASMKMDSWTGYQSSQQRALLECLIIYTGLI